VASYTIRPTTELMENYRQTTVMAPEQQLQALQDADGHLLVFSIGSANSGATLNLTVEVPGDRHGWRTIALTSTLPAQPCRFFSVAQRPDGTIHLGLARRESEHGVVGDRLYEAVLPAVTSARLQAPTWTALPYDGVTARPHVVIAGVASSEASSGGYLVADLVRDPDSNTHEITRYFIDPALPGGRAWQLHDVPVDIEGGDYVTALGRKGGAGVDGIYTSGQIDDRPQIVYTPLVNELRPGNHPLSAYLKLTAAGDVVADAIATCRRPDGETDLYAAAKGVLYRFDSDNQRNDAVAVPLLTHPSFGAVTDLHASHDPVTDSVTVWGRNTDDAVFATTYAADARTGAKQWSVPLTLLAGVQQVAPLLGRTDGANTIVAHTAGEELRVGVRSPQTTVWSWRRITLPPASTSAPAEKISSYTTRVEVRDEHNQAAARIPLHITAASRTPVYINHLYHVVGPTPITVPTDATGSVTIVEAVPRLTGTRFSFVVDGTARPTEVNPMDKAFKTAAGLSTVDALRSAKITTYVNGKRGRQRDLLKPGVDEDTLKAVAALNQRCAAVYDDPKKPPQHALLAATALGAEPFAVPDDAPVVITGDLFQHLEAETVARRLRAASLGATADGPAAVGAVGESFWQMLVRWFEDAWEFVVKIGEAIYRCVLEVIEDVVSAIRWVFDKIVAAIGDLIEFLRFLFEWDDFRRTKEVFTNVTRVFLDHQCDQLVVVRKDFDATMETIIEALEHWAGVDALSGLGDAGTGRVGSQGTADGPNAPGSLLSHHFQGNVRDGSPAGDPPVGPTTPTSVLEILEHALEEEGHTLGEAGARLRALVQKAPTMSVIDVLKDLVVIIGSEVLKSVRVVVDALLDVFILLARAALDALNAPIHIPVISDILNAIGIPDFSMLDAVCWVAAVPVTIGYKIGAALAGKGDVAPFPDNPTTEFLRTVSDFTQLSAAFGAPVLTASGDAAGVRPVLVGAAAGPIDISPTDAMIVSIALHSASGVFGIESAFLDSFECLIPNAAVPTPLTAACVSAAVLGGVSRAVANVLVPHDPLENLVARYYNAVFAAAFGMNKAIWGFHGWVADPTKDPTDYRARSAAFDAVLVIPAMVITCVHLGELAKLTENKDRTMAILDETSYLATYVGRVLYTAIVNGAFDSNEEVKLGFAAAMGITSVAHGCLQLTEAAVEGLG
jgi:hypothetical protein